MSCFGNKLLKQHLIWLQTQWLDWQLVVRLFLFHPRTAPKAISEGLKSKNFPVGTCPHVPPPSARPFARFMRSVKCTLEPPFSKSLIRRCERFRKVCPQCNRVVHAMECNRAMRLRKVYIYICSQCNTVVHVKRSVCDCGHVFASKKRKAQCTAVGEPENAMKRWKSLLSEEEL